MNQKKAIIIGAGPAGLTTAYELLKKSDIKPFVYEATDDLGGISKTANYKGNYIDIGGHRFFSKSDRVIDWWLNILPLQDESTVDDKLKGLGHDLFIAGKNNVANPEIDDKVMLICKRLSRIFFLRKFFNYPLSLDFSTFQNLGLTRILKIGFSYLKSRLFPIKNEKNLEEFFINRFGKELYKIFFKDYTEKVWGVPCNTINPEWGAQRIKGLSVTKTFLHAFKKLYLRKSSIRQKDTETSLISTFLYPKYGPGQLWNEVARIIKEKGGEINLNYKVVEINYKENNIIELAVKNQKTGKETIQKGDYFFSTMPVKDLINAMGQKVPDKVKNIAQGLLYRDFITVGLLLNKMKIKNETKIKTHNDIIPDSWIYIQETDVKVGRLQIFNNWSPYMVKDKDKVWLGIEYFCNQGDELWNKPDDEIKQFAINELAMIDIIDKRQVLDSVVIRMSKTYPAYFGTYEQFDIIRNFTDSFENLFLIGRNGMHRYNNQDHSMLTAMTAVENIINNVKSKDNIWAVNIEEEYHETSV